MRVSIKEIAGIKEGVLAGALTGRRVLGKLLEHTSREPFQPEPVFLDFDGVEIATASFLRESVLAFRDTVRLRRRSNLYPVIANPNELVYEELKVLVTQGDVLMLCRLDEDNQPHEPQLLGELDPKQRVTFDLVKRLGETDASGLMRDYGESERTTVQTAWNNRLASLVNLGVLVELSQGRTKRYRPLFPEN